MTARPALVLVVLFAGCFAPIDLDGRRCPCDEGWSCNAAGRCERASADAGFDAPRTDAPRPSDAGEVDVPNDVPGDAPVTPPDTPATPPDAGLDPCPPGALVCDDFEDGPDARVPPFDWNVGPSVRSTLRAHSGTASARFTATGASAPQHMVGMNPPSGTTDVWVRLWAYVPSSPGLGPIGVIGLSEAAAPFGNVTMTVDVSAQGAYSTVAGRYIGGTAPPTDVWNCLALHARLETGGRVEVYRGARLLGAEDIDTALPMGLGVISVGITYVAPELATPFEISIDDVAVTIDGTPLRCPSS